MQNITGILFMVAAMAAFAVTDTFVKLSSDNLAVGQILAIMGTGGGIIFAAMTRAKGHAIIARDFFYRSVMLRNLSEILGTVGFVTALSKIDISLASAVVQAMPLAVTLGAVVFLREPVGWRRWSAIFVGFFGVLLILRPGADGFNPDTLWAIGGMLGLSMRDLSTRMIPASVPTLRISSYGMAMLLPTGLVLMMFDSQAGAVPLTTIGLMMLAVTTGVLGYYAIIAGMRIGDVAVVAPFRYTRIIFALVIGVAVFEERPDAVMLLGVAITIGAGLYTFLRERRHPASQRPLSTGVAAK